MTTPEPKLRWYRPTPDRFILTLLPIEGLLWLSDRLGWPAWHKGYAVLVTVAVVLATLLLMAIWYVVALILRWRFQFSLRSLLILAVIVALPCSWLAVEKEKGRRQREAVVAIEKRSGTVMWDDEEWACPAWLRRLLGDDLFNSVVGVSFFDTRNGDAELEQLLEHLKGLDQLQTLNLDNTPVSDAGLEHIKTLGQLQELVLAVAQVRVRLCCPSSPRCAQQAERTMPWASLSLTTRSISSNRWTDFGYSARASKRPRPDMRLLNNLKSTASR